MVKLSYFMKSLVCTCLITAILGCATTHNQSAAQPLDDSAITAQVKAAISDDPTLRKFTIRVMTYKGEVVLKGQVDTQQDVVKATAIVYSVEGVKSLFNDLMVK